ADIFVATQSASGGVGEAAATRIRVFNGATGSLLREFTFRNGSPLQKGIRIAAGDIDGDGRTEIIAGSGAGSGAHVMVLDPLSGAVLRDTVAYPGFNGEVFVAAGDINKDGKADIITGAGQGGGPHVKVFDGASNAVTRSFFAYATNFTG